MGISAAQSPWLPAPGKSAVTISFVNQNSDKFYAGATKGDLPADLKQDTFSLALAYGINDSLALDISGGYAKSKFITVPGLAPDGGLKGLTDTRFGLRYRLLDDLADAPVTVTLGAAAIVAGNYKTGALPSIGDGANAVEVFTSIGKVVAPGVAVYGNLGYRDRATSVPNELFYGVGVSYSPMSKLSFALDHQVTDARKGLDIGGPGFSPDRFPEVQEDYSTTIASATFRFTPALGLSLQAGKKNGKRNTAESKILGLSLTANF